MSAMFDFISGKKNGALARAKASEEYALGHLEGMIEENTLLRSALKECADDLAAQIEREYRDTLDYPGAGSNRRVKP